MRNRNPDVSFLSIHLNNIPVQVKITADFEESISFTVEFKYNGQIFKSLYKPLSVDKLYFSDEISFDGIELLPIDKSKIASELNNKLNIILD
jgi:hypothetical protein